MFEDVREASQSIKKVGSRARSSGSGPMGDETSVKISKDDDKVRSLIESESGSIRKRVFEL